MKKKIVIRNGVNPYRFGSMHDNVFYIKGCAFCGLEEDMEILEKSVKTLKVYHVNKHGEINRQGEIMELCKINGTSAIVRDEYDRQFLAVLCNTYYSNVFRQLLISDAVITEEDKELAKKAENHGLTKKRWIIMHEFD